MEVFFSPIVVRIYWKAETKDIQDGMSNEFDYNFITVLNSEPELLPIIKT